MVMKRISFDNPLVLFFGGALFTGLTYFCLSFLNKATYIHSFFFRCWPIQGLNTSLFGVALIFIILRYYRLKDEGEVVKKIDIASMTTITFEKAKMLMDKIPSKYRQTISFRRLSEILRGYLYNEEVIRLNEELSRRDREEVDRGHLLLNSLRQIIPILGFLGTVLGLSLGMVKFPEHMSKAANIENLRGILKDFAASLSVAFDTTLLALGYAIIVVLAASLLKRKEESFVTQVDDKARELITKLSPIVNHTDRPQGGIEEVLERFADNFRLKLSQGISEAMEEWLSKWQSGFSSNMREFLDQLATQNGNFGKEMVEILRHNGNEFVKKLGEIKEGLHKPPHYEIIVKPLERGTDE